jgi:ribosomal protein L31
MASISFFHRIHLKSKHCPFQTICGNNFNITSTTGKRTGMDIHFFFQINLSVVEVDPASTGGVTDILHHMTWTLPTVPDKRPVPVVCYDDALSVQRMPDAKNAHLRSTG